MPDPDNDNPTPDFDDLIAQAQQLREEGKDEEAIAKYEEAQKIDGARPELCELMELYIKIGRPSEAIDLAISISAKVSTRYEQFSNTAEAVSTYNRIFDTLGKIPHDEIVDSFGGAHAILAIFTENLAENDPSDLHQKSIAMMNTYGWTDFHTKCYLEYLSASEENLEETLTTLREWAQENPAAWFYVGRLEQDRDRDYEATEAYGQVPENDPNYAWSMFEAGECWAVAGGLYEAEDYYQKALDVAPRSQKVRLEYLFNRIMILLEEAAENGFERDRVSRAYEFINRV
jgi:tetratricopeptide (TPR) repeat protein